MRILTKRIKAVTLSEIVIGLVIVALIFTSIIGVIMLFYKANVLVNAFVQLDTEAVYVRGYLDSFISNAVTKTVECNPVSVDVNNDGTNDQVLLRFESLLRDNKEYLIAVLQNVSNPVHENRTYSPLVIAEYDLSTLEYRPLTILTSPLITVVSANVVCSQTIETVEGLYELKGITLEFVWDTVVQYSDVFPGGKPQPIVDGVKVLVSTLVSN